MMNLAPSPEQAEIAASADEFLTKPAELNFFEMLSEYDK